MNSSTEKTEAYPTCEFKENLAILRQIYLFSRMPLESLKIFAYLCTKEVFQTGDILFHQDDDDGQAFYLMAGTAQLIRNTPEGEQVLREYSTESFIGGMSLMGKLPRLYSLKAATDITCLVMTREKFAKALAQFPDMMPRVIESIVEQVQAWEEQFLHHFGKSESPCLKRTGVSLV